MRQETVAVQVAAVARVEPAAGERLRAVLRVAPIAEHQVAATHPDFAAGAGADIAPCGIDDAQLAALGGAPGRAGLGPRFVGVQARGDRRGFGRAPDLDQRHAARVHGVDQAPGNERRAGADAAQARQVSAAPARVREQRVELRRHQHRQRDALAFDRRQRRASVELGVQRDAAARTQRRRREDVQAADVEQRQGRQDAVVGRERVHLDARVGVGVDRLLAQQHALRAAGRTRGPAQQQRCTLVDPCVSRRQDPRRISPREEGVPVRPARRRGAGLAEGDAARGRRRDTLLDRGRSETRVNEQQCRRAIAQHRAVLGRREAPVQRHEDGAQARAGEQRRQHRGTVQAEPGDAVVARHAMRAKRRGKGVDEAREGRVAERLTLETQRRLVRRALGDGGDPIGNRHRKLLTSRRLRAPPPSRCRPPRSR